MTKSSVLEPVAVCEATLLKLEEGCCEPGRSPRMKVLGDTLQAARTAIEQMSDEPASGDTVIELLEDAGAQIGRLQIGCCAPRRMPLYATFLEELTKAQKATNRTFHRGH